METQREYPWPKLGLKAFQLGSNRSTMAYLKWYGMGTTESYAEGFMKAIGRIMTTLHTPDEPGHPDQLFYPIAYLAQHYFELMVKHLIIQASALVPPAVTVADLSDTHNLEFLWKRLRPVIELLWPTGPHDDLDAVESVLLEFHHLDPHGMTFRYDSDNKRVETYGPPSRNCRSREPLAVRSRCCCPFRGMQRCNTRCDRKHRIVA